MTNNASPAGGFDLNKPTIISLLYLGSFVVGITGLIGVVMAFVWKGDSHEPWEATHFTWLINTFWIGLAGSVIGVMLTLVLIGIPILIAVAILVIVRSVMSLLRAQRREAMPNPGSWML